MAYNNILTLSVVTLLVAYFFSWKQKRSKLPPDPPGLPLIGNLHQAPSDSPWVAYEQWIAQYGPLVYLNMGGTSIILVGDHDTARDLLDKKANIYSSRPRLVMAQELVCKGNHIMFKPFNEDFLLHQRLEAPVLSPRASSCYTAIQDLESKQLLKNLLTSNDFPNLFERFTASIVYSITFGMRIITGEEWQLKESHECLENIVLAGSVGVWIVDAIPALNHLPSFLAPWKKTAEAWHNKWAKLHTANFTDAQNRPGWNWAKDFKNAKEAQNMTESEVAWDLGILCDAGVETTNITLQIFVLACLAYPNFITKARDELDRVVGTERLPDFTDLEHLAYINAIIEENFRWRHIVPGGIPHATSQEDVYKGYRIPKGSIVMPVFSAMRHDTQLFDNPEEFRPERWLTKTQPSNFGYGRRICPGRFIARNSLAIAVARILWAFDIRSANGEKVHVAEESFTGGLLSIQRLLRRCLRLDPKSGGEW